MKKEISIFTTEEGADYIISAFFSQGIDGIKIDDPNIIQDVINNVKHWDYLEKTLIDNTSNFNEFSVTVYLNEEDVDVILKNVFIELNDIIGVNFGSLKVNIIDHLEINWLEEWMKYYIPIISGKFIVIPIWLKKSIENVNKTSIYINPGSAFGTGEHETTKMCLNLMSKVNFSNKSVADVGSGSGILGIAALKSGAKKCTFLDIDSSTLMSAKNNYELNFNEKIEDGIIIDKQSNINFLKSNLLLSDNNKYDIILANITAEPLIRLASEINKNFSKGTLICSGIIIENKDKVIKIFQDNGFKLDKILVSNSWVALSLSR